MVVPIHFVSFKRPIGQVQGPRVAFIPRRSDFSGVSEVKFPNQLGQRSRGPYGRKFSSVHRRDITIDSDRVSLAIAIALSAEAARVAHFVAGGKLVVAPGNIFPLFGELFVLNICSRQKPGSCAVPQGSA